MSANFLRYGALGVSLISTQVSAIGLGEIHLHSAIGESLRAEIPLISTAGSPIETACFTLSPITGSDLPVVTSASLRLIRNSTGYRLLIVGRKPITEPVFMLSVRANCGVDLQRDYVLMPEPPISSNELAAPEAPVRSPIASIPQARIWHSKAGDTLDSIAEALAAGNPAQQRRTLAALRRANPELAGEGFLPEGSSVVVPKPKKRAATESTETDSAAPSPPAESPAPRPKRERTNPPNQAAKGSTDKLVIGEAPSQLRPGEAGVAQRAHIAEMEERMLKMETTLHTLNAEVSKLNDALTLTTEALVTQNKLQLAQNIQPVSVQAQLPAAPARTPPSHDNWLELLLSALAGGGISAGLAAFLGRRKAHNGNAEMPLAFAGYQPEIQVTHSDAPAPASHTQEAPRSNIDIPLSEPSVMPSDNTIAQDINLDENDSALELAEIMLSFGRVRGAAETLALYIEEAAPDNIQPWLMLLDLYRRGDMKQEFEALAPSITRKFNLHIADWDQHTTPVSGLKALEDYAHITLRVVQSWGQQSCLDYLYELVHDNRSGRRGGFPLEVVEEIVLLMHVLENGYGLKHAA